MNSPGYLVNKDAPHLDPNARFETRTDCRKEDLKRTLTLRNAAKKHADVLDLRAVRRLARKLEQSGENGDYFPSPASSLAMGLFRHRFIGAVWKLFTELAQTSAPTTFTVIPRTWQFTPEQLMQEDPRKLIAVFRTDLYQMKAASAGGWLLVFLHGEFDPVARIFRLHLHGLASREMIEVVDRLRELPRYETREFEPDGSKCIIRLPIRVRRKPLYNIPAPLTYIAQSFWPSRSIYIDKNGDRRRVRNKGRIPEPYHSQVLLWLDQWRVKSLMLLVGLKESNTGLTPTRRRCRSS